MLYLPRKSTNSSATTAIPPKAAKILTAREIASYTLVGMIWKKAKCSGSCSFLPTKSRSVSYTHLTLPTKLEV